MRPIVAGGIHHARGPHPYPPAIQLTIGIPTRNRADLAVVALDSVLRQPQRGVRVLVSDNSTDADERARLERHCASIDGPVTYVRPPEPLPMTDHWEWLWRTIRAADPTHVAYLTDRMVLAEGALAAMSDAVRTHPGKVVSYHHDNVEDRTTPVLLMQTPWTGRLVELDARRVIELSSRGRYGDYLPRFLNSVAPVSVVEGVESRFGDVFGSVSPDYRFAFRCLALCESILYLDRACLIEHGHTRSAGGSFRRGYPSRDSADWAARLAEQRFGATPEPALETLANAVFQEYCAVRAEAGPGRFPEVDRRGYLMANAISADRTENRERREELRAFLRELGWSRVDGARHAAGLAVEMAGYLAAHPGAIPRTLKRQLWDRPPGTPAAYLLSRLGIEPPTRHRWRFGSASEALEHARTHPRPPTPYAWHVHRLERAGAVVATGRFPARLTEVPATSRS